MSAIFNLFYLYDPWFFHFLRMSLVAGVAACAWLLYQFWKSNYQKSLVIPVDSLLVLVGLIVFSLLPLLINGTRDFSVVIMYVKGLLLFLFGVAAYNAFYQIPLGREKLVTDLRIGVFVQFVLGLLGLFGINAAIDFALNAHAYLPRFYGSEQEYRLYNLTSAAFFQLSLFYLVLLHFLLAYDEKHRIKSSWWIFAMLCIGLISGRTFLTLSLLSLLVYFKWRYLPWFVAFTALVLALAYFMPQNPYVEHALEPVINLLNGADHLSSSTDTLMKNHLFMPTLSQFLTGDGMYMTGAVDVGRYYGHTDSGFLRQILYGGFSYALVCFLVTYFFVRKVALNWFQGSWKFTLSLLVVLAFCNIKADTFAFPGIMFVMLMFLSQFGTSGRSRTLFSRES